MTTTIYFPEMGEGVIEGTLTRWLVQEGQSVQQYEPVAELETDKVTTEISTEVAGTILKLCVIEGDTVAVETDLAYVGSPGEEIPADDGHETAVPGNGQGRPTAAVEKAPEGIKREYRGRVSPVVGRIAAEHHVNLSLVEGTGRNGRVTKRDILAYVEQRDKGREPVGIEEDLQVALDVGDKMLPMTSMRRAIAEHMVMSKRTSPHVTTVFEFDFTAAAAHRAAHKEAFAREGARLTFTVYLVSAIVQALKQHPLANSVWTDEGVILRGEINIGMAAAVPGGLIVPVIKQADSMNLIGLAHAINDLTDRARNKKLLPGEVQGGTFSLTNHGTSGSLFATPIINQPQAGILGIGKIEKRVKVIDDAIGIRPLAFASFTFDHRILDGATADSFVSTIKELIENWH